MVIRRLLLYLKPYQKRFWIAFAALLLATGADVVLPVIVSHFIDHYLVPRTFDRDTLLLLGGSFLLLQFLSAGLHYYQLFSFQTIAQWVIRQLRIDVFAKVQHLGLSFFDRTPDGSLVSRITNDTEAIKDMYINVLSSFMQNFIFIIGVFIAMFVLDVRLALWCLILLPVSLTLMQGYRRLSSKVYRISRQKLAQMNAKLNESIQGMNIIQSLRQEARLRREFGSLNEEHYRAALKNVKLFGLMLRPATQLLSVLATVAVLNFFGFESFMGTVKIGVLYGFLNLLDRIFEPVNQMMMRLSQLQQAVVSAERVFELLDRTEYAPQKQGEKNPVITEGRIEFANVSFSYDGKNDVLKNISFVAEPGQTVALVGHTGSGKSSIINLLMRFYPVERGEIKIDGHPLQTYDDQELRSKIGLVLQDPFLFVGDVKSNIRLHNESITDEQIKEAAQFVQAAPFIEKLPRGYEEPVVERGATFSSGQRQLISFARTMAIHPKILVLDEATASVDTETEEAIQAALQKMRQGRTTIAIAHRLSTIQDADLILVLHRGEIVERGSHQELLAMKGLYHKMYLLQTYGSAVEV
ncbi:ABC transporter ATP-binding protein [Lihuaxuella thermophila]|uniref:ATP-binding cassette, subfamily B n=1 Tax=Lihuaxuella thermophila TaxID=1173111 RepID=A0A1H8FWT5_9BACL|nr:ABC transporter transmembrane domain-containing protein [Lihuaxuella thermophila]SEN36109.1 ATP-binding cassette, subfamily B [Lihuaxuella thermophila]